MLRNIEKEVILSCRNKVAELCAKMPKGEGRLPVPFTSSNLHQWITLRKLRHIMALTKIAQLKKPGWKDF
jgi:hypothetical protein